VAWLPAKEKPAAAIKRSAGDLHALAGIYRAPRKQLQIGAGSKLEQSIDTVKYRLGTMLENAQDIGL
jgi:hypothetical protein